MFILRLAASSASASSAAGFLFLYCFWVRGIPATASSEFPLALFRAFTDFQGCIAVHLPRFILTYKTQLFCLSSDATLI